MKKILGFMMFMLIGLVFTSSAGPTKVWPPGSNDQSIIVTQFMPISITADVPVPNEHNCLAEQQTNYMTLASMPRTNKPCLFPEVTGRSGPIASKSINTYKTTAMDITGNYTQLGYSIWSL